MPISVERKEQALVIEGVVEEALRSTIAEPGATGACLPRGRAPSVPEPLVCVNEVGIHVID
jgi:hypothetical protein